MWSVSQLCRCASTLRAVNSKLLVPTTRSSLAISNAVTRQLVTPAKYNNVHKGYRLVNLTKSSNILARFCSLAPKQSPKNPKIVGYWLLGCSGMVFTAVVLGMASGYFVLLYSIYYIVNLMLKTTNAGGVTRLTESGLSMVTWRLLGEKLPTTEEEWQSEFQRYQQFPEYKYKNQNISLSEFKWIWWMEFAHRTWGRCIGAAVFIPAALFWAKGYFDRPMKIRVGVYSALVAAQGLMGWYMVKSGLEDRFQAPDAVPRVSQYRLAAHLSLAFLLYAGLLGGALRVLRPFPAASTIQKLKELTSVTALAHTVKAMAFLTAISGAFVAGLDAGLVYNSFPKMGDYWIPDDILAFSPSLRNFTENPTTVQFDHRVLGSTTVALATLLWLRGRRTLTAPVARVALNAVAGMAWMQVTLGILTLLYYVPTPVAASHQSGSLVLLSLAIWLTHEIKLLKYIPK